MFTHIKYKALNTQHQPFIFAYSGYLDEERIAETKEAGFDGCFDLLT
jgi:hypothetical protein